ncbi:MAG: hypothetical protein U0744_18715 [Gemmataceae bacterium]
MARNFSGTPVWRRTAELIALASILWIGVGSVAAQTESPAKVRAAVKSANDAYKRGDYDAATQLFGEAQSGQELLTKNERQDLAAGIQQNQVALKERLEGKALLQRADQALRKGDDKEAAALLRNATSNQYLSAADREFLAALSDGQRKLTAARYGTEAEKGDYRSLLASARKALEQGDYAAASALCDQAEKSGTKSWTSGLPLPFSDSPARIRRDIQVAQNGSTGSRSPLQAMKNLWPWSRNSEEKTPKIDPPAPVDPGVPHGVGSSPIAKDKLDPNGSKPPQFPVVPVGTSGPKEVAKRKVVEGYQALEAGDLATARRLAEDAKSMNVTLDPLDPNPDRLLADIQRRSGGEKNYDAAALAKNGTPDDARRLVKEGRELLQKERLDEAEKACNIAGAIANARWGLFEDSPTKLQADIQRVRSRIDRDQSTKLMTDARKLFAQGNFHEAKIKAYEAQRLRGPSSWWDRGDRPEAILADIHRAELQKKTPDPLNPNAGNPTQTASFESSTEKMQRRQRAMALVAESRDLERRGFLAEARMKAAEANNLRAEFAPNEDSPQNVMLSLSSRCDSRIKQLLQTATDRVTNYPNDPTRFEKASIDLDSARKLAQAFQFDPTPIEQKAQWLQQAAVQSGSKMLNAVTPPPLSGLAQTGLQTPPGADPRFDSKRKDGLDKLERARIELRAGNSPMARRLTEEAFDKTYGVQAEASQLLRSIDAEEHNQTILAANRGFEAGAEAYARKDYNRAKAIFAGVDLRLLAPDRQRRIGEWMETREMQSGVVTAAANKIPTVGTSVGKASVGDLDDPGLKSVRALEEIQLQKLRDRILQAQRTALDYAKAGQEQQAIDTLKDALEDIKHAPLDGERTAPLVRQIDGKMSQYRTLLAQRAIEKQQNNMTASLNGHNENKRNTRIRDNQTKVAELIKESRDLYRENKLKEALAAARKAKELDPDNIAADALATMASIKYEEKRWKEDTADNERRFLDELRPGMGKAVTSANPFAIEDPDRYMRAKDRASNAGGIHMQARTPSERAIESKLKQPINLNFKDTPLDQVLRDLQVMSGINVVPDKAAFQENNISLQQPMSLEVENISLKSALNILLKQARLTYVIKDEVLSVTTKEHAGGALKQVIHPIADLVVPVENHMLPSTQNLQAALERHTGNQGAMYQQPTPAMSGYNLPGGAAVGSYSNGLGSAMSGQSNSSGGTSVTKSMPNQTMEDMLMSLVKNTVAQSSWSDVGGPGTIQYYPLGMALVINQYSEVQEDVAALLAALRRLQDLEVAIEMKLVQVSESFFERIGLDFDVNFKTPQFRGENQLINGAFTPFGPNRNLDIGGKSPIVGMTPAGTLTPDLNIPLKSSSFDFTAPTFGGYPGTLGADGGLSLGLAFLSDIQVFMFLEAAQGDRRSNIMQAPKITVFNGQTAFISVQDQIFLLTGVQAATSGAQTFFVPQNQPFPVGTTLQITPVVSADRRFVRLNLTPNFTSLSTAVPLFPVQIPIPQVYEGPNGGVITAGQPVLFQMFFQQPTFSTITLNTTVNVPDGGTVLLGGLKVLAESRNEFGPPVLSKIPYLSRLFRNIGYGREATSLMLMVTPRIIINEEEEQIYLGNLPPIPR